MRSTAATSPRVRPSAADCATAPSARRCASAPPPRPSLLGNPRHRRRDAVVRRAPRPGLLQPELRRHNRGRRCGVAQPARLPYLNSHADPYCVRRDAAAWHAEVPLAGLAADMRQCRGLACARKHRGGARGSSAARRIARCASSSSAATAQCTIVSASASALWHWPRTWLGPRAQRCVRARRRNGALVFDGRGHGHGVGLCQAGATEMAAEGNSAREILAFYFPGTAVRITPGDDGWRETQADRLTLRATHRFRGANRRAATNMDRSATSASQRALHRHTSVRRRLPSRPPLRSFVNSHRSPGWMLASTRPVAGSTIVLQPESCPAHAWTGPVRHAAARDAACAGRN
jgi:stage II sporulation protein D